MRRLVTSRLTAGVLCIAAGVLCSAAAAAAQAPLDSELGRWLDRIAPELAETLAQHPRFRGETLRLVVLTPGNPEGRSNRLAEAIEQRLRQRLLAVEGVRLAAESSARRCEPPRPIDYLIRIDLTPVGSREARVQVAVVDLAESLWVGGISHEWEGQLSAAERSALGSAVTQAEPGSAGSPIPLGDADAVAAALKADLLCTLPRGLDGPLYVTVPERTELSRVALALQSALRYEPVAALTADRGDAAWLLELAPRHAVSDVGELELVLTDPDGGPRQRVASVFVLAPALAQQPAKPPPLRPRREEAAPPARPAPAVAPARTLLSMLEMQPAAPEGICDDRQARINACVEVRFELHEPAYLFVLHTRGHALVDAPCDARLERAEPGERRFRLRVPPSRYAEDPDSAPDAGLYVLAVRDRTAARQLREVLGAAPGACSGGGLETADWLAGLERVLGRYPDRVHWRALHLAHDTRGIVAL
ncbi:MAG TPA: hypothetical protein VF210_11005 [Pseudomonadales bacterium]